MENDYCAYCKYPVSYFKYAGNVICVKCGATTIPLNKLKNKDKSDV